MKGRWMKDDTFMTNQQEEKSSQIKKYLCIVAKINTADTNL